MKPLFSYIGIVICSFVLFFMGFSFALTSEAQLDCWISYGDDVCKTYDYHMILELVIAFLQFIALILIFYSRNKEGKHENLD